jgi:hypothetical protein
MSKGQTLHSIIKDIHSDYFSDLNANDIPDSEIGSGQEENKSPLDQRKIVETSSMTKEDAAI